MLEIDLSGHRGSYGHKKWPKRLKDESQAR